MPLDGVKHIILVLSGKGGVGKSSVTLQLALALSAAGRSVGILDLDLTGPSVPRMVGLETATVRQAPGGWLPVTVHGNAGTNGGEGGGQLENAASTQPQLQAQPQAQPQTPRGSLRVMSLGFLLRDRGDAVIWRGPKKTAMIRQFLSDVLWGPTDYLLLDTPPGTGDEHIALAEQLLALRTGTSAAVRNVNVSANVNGAAANGENGENNNNNDQTPALAGALVVTTPQAISTADVRKELNFCAQTCIPVLGVVENMAGYACPCCGEISNVFSRGGGEVMAHEMGVRFLGRVPVDVGFGCLVEGFRAEKEEREAIKAGEGDGKGEAAATEVEDGDALLMDRYKGCASEPLFRGFAAQVIGLVEG